MSRVIKNVIHKARIYHYCNDCRRTIKPGDKYRRMFGSAYSIDPPHELKLCDNCTYTGDDGHEAIQNISSGGQHYELHMR